MIFFFQAEDGIRDLVRSRGLGDVYKRQLAAHAAELRGEHQVELAHIGPVAGTADGAFDLFLSLIHI